MRIVLYAEDMEAITVLELSQFAADHMERYGRVRIAVIEPIPLECLTAVECTIPMPKVVEIRAEKFRRNGIEHLMLFTRDEEAALMLKSDLLPGQRRDGQDHARQQFARGFLAGLDVALRG